MSLILYAAGVVLALAVLEWCLGFLVGLIEDLIQWGRK